MFNHILITITVRLAGRKLYCFKQDLYGKYRSDVRLDIILYYIRTWYRTKYPVSDSDQDQSKIILAFSRVWIYIRYYGSHVFLHSAFLHCRKRHNWATMSRLFQPLCFNQVQSRVWGRLWGSRAESSGSLANMGSIISQLNPLMSPSVRCVWLYLKRASNLGPSAPADQLVFILIPGWWENSRPRPLPTHLLRRWWRERLILDAPKKLCSLLERAPPGGAESRYRAVAMRRASWCGETKRERGTPGWASVCEPQQGAETSNETNHFGN